MPGEEKQEREPRDGPGRAGRGRRVAAASRKHTDEPEEEAAERRDDRAEHEAEGIGVQGG